MNIYIIHAIWAGTISISTLYIYLWYIIIINIHASVSMSVPSLVYAFFWIDKWLNDLYILYPIRNVSEKKLNNLDIQRRWWNMYMQMWSIGTNILLVERFRTVSCNFSFFRVRNLTDSRFQTVRRIGYLSQSTTSSEYVWYPGGKYYTYSLLPHLSSVFIAYGSVSNANMGHAKAVINGMKFVQNDSANCTK